MKMTRNRGDDWLRVVLDSRLRTPGDAVVVASDPGSTLIVHTADAADEDRARLEAAGVELAELPADELGRVDIDALLDLLGDRGISALLVEGGATVHGSFFDADFVDELFIFVAPTIIGGEAPAAVGGLGADTLELARRYAFDDVRRHDDDLELHCVRPEDADVHGSD